MSGSIQTSNTRLRELLFKVLASAMQIVTLKKKQRNLI